MKKAVLFFLPLVALFNCTSSVGEGRLNADVFAEAKAAAYPLYTSSAYSFDGGIQALKNTIDAYGTFGELTTGLPVTIEGIVTIPSDYGFTVAGGVPSGSCSGYSPVIFGRSFVLQDQNTGILVAYGQDPALTTGSTTSQKYYLNAQVVNRAVFGDRLRITVTHAQRYGDGTNSVALVKDFTDPAIVSSRNSVAYASQAGAFSRTTDLYRVRRLEGYILKSPAYVENDCSGGPYRFQYDHQSGYAGELCVGTLSGTTCTGTVYAFKLSYNLGAGTLSGFDTGTSFSYNVGQGARVRMTGPVFVPRFAGSDSYLMLMLSQKHQVETIQ
ncbi:MAG: hypothetical protein ACOY5B_12395 [Spirochaetota bacterium]